MAKGSVNKSYDATTGILTISMGSVTANVPGNTWTPATATIIVDIILIRL